MARSKSKSQLEAELDDANDYIEELESRLDDIAGIVSGDEDQGDNTESDDDDRD